MDDGGMPVFEALERSECLRLLSAIPVGRIGLTARALPVVLPVNFALFGEDVLWRSAQGTKLNAAARGLVVAFEADSFDQRRQVGWSVMVQGIAQVVADPEDLVAARALNLESWALDGVADRYVRLSTEFMTGMRISRKGAG